MDGPTRILCVDGEPEVLQSLERLFLDEGYEILTARSGEEGLSVLAAAQPVHVVLADCKTAASGDVDFLPEVCRRWPDAVRIGLCEDTDAAASAVDEGRIYKSLRKPLDGLEAQATIGNALERYRLVGALRGGDEAALRIIAQEVELRDEYTRGHCDRVANLAMRIASVLGLPGETKRFLRYGGWLHDCGKIGVPAAILNLPGKLTPEQYAVVRNHPTWGAEVARLAGLPPEVVDILRSHHERFDGRGYPAGLRGQKIPLTARIVTVADVFDAVSTDRPYAKGYGPEEAMGVVGVMQGAALDPEIVDAMFLAMRGGGDLSL